MPGSRLTVLDTVMPIYDNSNFKIAANHDVTSEWHYFSVCGFLADGTLTAFIQSPPSYGITSSFREYQTEKWVWDQYSKSPEVCLSRDLQNAYFHTDPVFMSMGTAGVRGTKGFTEGEHYWEVIFLEPPSGTSVMVGVGTEKALLHLGNFNFVDLIGLDTESWGLSYKGDIWHNGRKQQYCEAFFQEATVIGCHLNFYNGTLTFYKNGENLGVAFTGLDKVKVPLFPTISSTACDTELGLGLQFCRYLTLQEKCLQTIKRTLDYDDSIDCLPLPKVLKASLKEL
ncbi:hypothetical protein FSP39_019344 [Pinctada imbricata]|uniref:SPRY domain-containing SOCS box protein 3 n=1 Tax=Pinctada imbricata TaxID=66713 RepID=A0AA88Y002_PINIB|nr:hypothetical protein FSP39_019344 [Pinctada imbricata]